MTAHAAETAASPDPAGSPGWAMHLVPRTGAPPLRFSGRLLYTDSMRGAHGDLYLRLWEMRRSGFVLEFADPQDSPAIAQSLTLDTLEEAVDVLERFCADLRLVADHAEDGANRSLNATLALLVAKQVQRSRIDSFESLTGTALAIWDRWGDTTPHAAS